MITHKLDNAAIGAILHSPSGGVAKDLLRRGYRVQAKAKRNLGGGEGYPKRVNLGHLRNSIAVDLATINGQLTVRVGSNLKYALYVHQGTGLYGPRHRVIRPKSAKFLVFKSKKYGAKKGKFKGKVVVPYVRGMKPNPFLARALSAVGG